MPASTARLALSYPIPDDAVDVPRDVLALAARLDPFAAIYASGTIAVRPVAGVPGRFDYATDAGTLSYDTGAAWVVVGPYSGAGSSGPPLVSSLPLAPVDGQECYYLADATNGIVWLLRYRAASASAYKWEYVGGGRLAFQTGAANHDVTWTSYAAIPNNYNLTIPLAGEYATQLDVMGYNNTANQVGIASFAVAGQTAANDAWGAYLGTNNTNGNSSPASYAPIPINTAGRQLNIQARTSAGTTRITWFRLYAQPIRVG